MALKEDPSPSSPLANSARSFPQLYSSSDFESDSECFRVTILHEGFSEDLEASPPLEHSTVESSALVAERPAEESDSDFSHDGAQERPSSRRGSSRKSEVEKNESPNIMKRVIISMTKECSKLTKKAVGEEDYEDFKMFCRKASVACSLKMMYAFYSEAMEEGRAEFLAIFIRLFNRILRDYYTPMLVRSHKVKAGGYGKYFEVKNQRLMNFWLGLEMFYAESSSR